MSITLNGTTGLAGTNGSAGTPAVQGEDTNTGIFFPAADTVAVATAGTERMRVTSAGNVGIGTSSPAVQLHVYRNTTDGSAAALKLENAGTTSSYATLDATAGPVQTYLYSDAAGNALGVAGATLRTVSNHPLIFGTNNIERLRIDSSGNSIVSSSGGVNPGVIIDPAGGVYIGNNAAASGHFFSAFYRSLITIGSITQNGTTGVSYNTSSDYRLKENVAPMQNALDTVAQLNPVTYTWKADGSAGQGFIAHELQAVVPDCVTGEKDAVDETGNPQYQGVDTSFLVATLCKAIQELTARVAQLEAQ